MSVESAPLVSIILPTLDRGHCLGRAVASVVAQTHPCWELIVANNGRTRIAFADPRVTVIDAAEVTSAAYARNRALGRSTGELVCFLDDDDELAPNYLATFLTLFAARPGLRMAKCRMVRREVVNETYGTPTVVLRREVATPTWEPIPRQDRAYYAAIIARHDLSEEAGTLALLPDVLVTSGVDPVGGLREGNL